MIKELVSPDDLVRACGLFSSLKLPCGIGSFSGGQQYVYTDEYSEQEMSLKLLRLAQSRPNTPLTELDASQHLHISVLMGRDLLRMAEQKGYLCRDETVHMLCFYENRFLQELLP